MTDELYEPVPDVEAYLRRIGVADAKRPTLEFLDELIFAHQRSVPFDNLDVCERGMVPSLGIADLFEKVVAHKRGGYCFELNALFGALLKALGYQVRPYMARVLIRPVPRPLITHRASFVTIDGKDYIADVGFGGPQPTFAVPLEDGATSARNGQAFVVRRCDDLWRDLVYVGSSGTEQPAQRICTMPVGEEDFIPLSFYQAANPDSVFRLNRMVNITTKDGALNLRNNTLATFAGGKKTVTEIEDEEAITELLRESFGITRDW